MRKNEKIKLCDVKKKNIKEHFLSLCLFSVLYILLMIHLIPLRNHQKLRHLYEDSFIFPYISITTLPPAAEAIICPSRQKYTNVDAPFLI
jgi:hypothetical protein